MFHMYGFFIGIAIVVGYSVAEKIEPRVKEGAGAVIVAGILGARIYHVIDFWTYYSIHLNEMFYVWNGGLSFWGALMLGSAVAWIYFKGLTLKVMEAIVTGLPLAQAIGRLGNWANQEFVNPVMGIPWWGMEAILDLVLFGLLLLCPMKYRVWIYLAGYGLIRYILQPYRA